MNWKILLLGLIIVVAGCNQLEGDMVYFAELCSKSEAIESYGVDFVFAQTNETFKRMYFAVDNHTNLVRTDWTVNGTDYVSINDGINLYMLYPETMTGVYTPVPAAIQPAGNVYPSAACVPQHFGAVYDSTRNIMGKDCYFLNYTIGEFKGASECYDIATGTRVTSGSYDQVVWYYDNYEFDIDQESVFSVSDYGLEEIGAEEMIALLQG